MGWQIVQKPDETDNLYASDWRNLSSKCSCGFTSIISSAYPALLGKRTITRCKSMTYFIDVPTMSDLVHDIGVAPFIGELAAALRDDFKR
ncbi:ornithine cyclodeaminase [Pseudomonas putida DOT-T1E]|uniref:Ornithine cyclodeaminase n=1 Tax=Pseudomonas putida (strain DOT-T1E) TaxID=1196325 RepID=I7BP46_PSEPT|nr:ornithine cyclodeaminase [Pseudomonas putida DOT-T1E]